MATFTVRPEGIIRQPALTMPGNATGSEAACTALTGSQIRAICGLGTTDNVTFNTVTATTSVLTPLVNNASAALTLGNSTYGVTVQGAMTVPKVTITAPDGSSAPPFIVSVPDQNPYAAQFLGRNTNKSLYVWMDNSGNGNIVTDNAFVVQTGGYGNTRLTIASTGAATFSGDISMQKATQGYIRAYGTGGVNNIAMYDDNTNGILSTSSGNLNLVPTGGTVAVTGGITASGVVSHGAYTVATLPAAGSNAGKMAQVTDSNVAASGNYGATVAAGGANRVKVFSDGTNWVIA